MAAFVYIVSCSDRTFYTGSTLDLGVRLRQHNAGKASKYTRSRLPVILVYCEKCRDLPAAYKREYQIKRLTRREKEKLVRSGRRRRKGGRR
jgi:putative endonuclease